MKKHTFRINLDCIRGFIVAIALRSLLEDFLYRTPEEYAHAVLNGAWVSRAVTIPLAVILLVMAWALGKVEIHHKDGEPK